MTEMTKLAVYLMEKNIPFHIFNDCIYIYYNNIVDPKRIFCYIISNKYTRGGDKGLLELRGFLFRNDSIGFLDADLAIKEIMRAIERHELTF